LNAIKPIFILSISYCGISTVRVLFSIGVLFHCCDIEEKPIYLLCNTKNRFGFRSAGSGSPLCCVSLRNTKVVFYAIQFNSIQFSSVLFKLILFNSVQFYSILLHVFYLPSIHKLTSTATPPPQINQNKTNSILLLRNQQRRSQK
jgi:hypothetical protein